MLDNRARPIPDRPAAAEPPEVGTPTCPLNSGTVTGTWTNASVLAIAGQDVMADDFDALTDALISNTAYANVHQTGLPTGEIRGQVRTVEREHDHEYNRGD